MSRSIEAATAATAIDDYFSSSSSTTSRDNNMMMSQSRVSRKTITHQNNNHKSIGRTAFTLAIVILPTAILICLGYFAYSYFGDGRNVMLLGDVEDNKEGSADNKTTILFNNTNNVEETQQANASSPINKEISTAYTAYEQVPHDTTSFTQGLTYGDDGYLYETTGLRGQSKLNKIDPNTFQVIKSINLDDMYFGEGSTYYTDNDGNGRLILLTYTKQTAFIYDPATLTLIDSFQYTTTPPKNEGWGITYDPTEHEFIVSDGTSTLYIWDSRTYQEKRQIHVTRFDGTPQYHLNELEFINDLICCNIWYQDTIICVDKVTGRSVREYDLSELYPMEERGGYHNTMNGMALGSDHVFITGKRWDRMFKVRFDDWDTMFSR